MVNGFSEPSILQTYESERKQIAQQLIAFDHHFSRLFSGRPAKDVMEEEGVSMEEFKIAFQKGGELASGIGEIFTLLGASLALTSISVAVDYGASLLVAKEEDVAEQGKGTDILRNRERRIISKPQLATKIDIGKRMASFKVLNHADARPWHLQELLKSNGRWRVVVFPGRLTEPHNMQRLEKLGELLGGPNSFIRQFTPPGKPIDSVIEVLTVHSGPRAGIELLDLPEAFHPHHGDMGWDYWKVYVDEISYHEGHGEAYANYGIDPSRGASVILRPDQYVSWVGEVDDYEQMSRFFAGFMKQQVVGKPGAQNSGAAIATMQL